MISRRRCLAGILASGLLASCRARPGAPREVVVYSSVDGPILRPILAAFEAASGVSVRAIGDTEATKTTGLMQRALADVGRFDVWWSNEPFATIRLAGEGVLAPFEPGSTSAWSVREPGGLWHGFASRFRVFVRNTARVGEPPTRLADLASPAWKGRLGIARPEFGTTRGHLAALLQAWGRDAFRAWAEAIGRNRPVLLDGNSSVVRAAAHGEIDVGLTDTDDVYAGGAQGWPVALSFEAFDESCTPPSLGALEIPGTIALARNAPHGTEARAFIDFAMGEAVERMLTEGESRTVPLRAGAREAYTGSVPERAMAVDLTAVADRAQEAVEIASRAWA